MPSPCISLDAATAVSYIGKTALMELRWDDEPESMWQLMHIVGVVLPMEGVCDHSCFMAVYYGTSDPYPERVFFHEIRTLRAMQHRDRHGFGNVLGCIAHPNSAGSRAALPARRNSSTVPSNGSTGAAHP
ncbi:hypothetical protein [Pseudomonas sp.]|uniref:hypothetical protein n=1 Tax=Pseudomonas sp. TaxID=306 RepID=UPI003C79484C